MARAGIYNLLALFFEDPSKVADLYGGPEKLAQVFESWKLHLPDYELDASLTNLNRAIKELIQERGAEPKEHSGLDHLSPKDAYAGLPPYETEYTAPHVFAKAQAIADIAGFYKAFGFTSEGSERPDHISVELEFMRVLCLMEAYADVQHSKDRLETTVDAERKFLSEHLAGWIRYFSQQLAEHSVNPFQQALGEFCKRFLDLETERLDAKPTIVAGQISPPKPDGRDTLSCDGCV